MNYDIEWGNKSVIVKFQGDINIIDLFKVSSIIQNDSRYIFLKSVISDFQKVTNLSLSKTEIQKMSTLHVIPAILNPNLKFSIVSNNLDINDMVLEYYDLMKVNEWEMKLFDNLEESIEWSKQK